MIKEGGGKNLEQGALDFIMEPFQGIGRSARSVMTIENGERRGRKKKKKKKEKNRKK